MWTQGFSKASRTAVADGTAAGDVDDAVVDADDADAIGPCDDVGTIVVDVLLKHLE